MCCATLANTFFDPRPRSQRLSSSSPKQLKSVMQSASPHPPRHFPPKRKSVWDTAWNGISKPSTWSGMYGIRVRYIRILSSDARSQHQLDVRQARGRPAWPDGTGNECGHLRGRQAVILETVHASPHPATIPIGQASAALVLQYTDAPASISTLRSGRASVFQLHHLHSKTHHLAYESHRVDLTCYCRRSKA